MIFTHSRLSPTLFSFPHAQKQRKQGNESPWSHQHFTDLGTSILPAFLGESGEELEYFKVLRHQVTSLTHTSMLKPALKHISVMCNH